MDDVADFVADYINNDVSIIFHVLWDFSLFMLTFTDFGLGGGQLADDSRPQ
jgi:hypothetical protein